MNLPIISSILLLALLGHTTSAYRSPFAQVAQRYEEQEPIEQQSVYSYGAPAAYRFSYSTPEGLLSRASSGSSSQYARQVSEGSSNYAQLAHEQSSDGSGEVVGRYAYVDPYGKLRVVNYRAGRNGYQATGDIGPDEEALRQQQELYANDASYQLQQQAWQQVARGEPVNIGAGIQQVVYSATGGSNAASSAASSAAASSSSSGSEWTSLNEGSQGSSANYATKNQNQQFAERYTAAGGVKSPAAQLRQQTTHVVSQSVDSEATKSVQQQQQQSSSASAASAAASSSAYTAPQVTQYSTKTVHQAPVVKSVQTTYTYQAPAKIVVQPAKIIQSTKSTKSVQQQYSGFQSPAARLVAISNGSASSSSASASASAAAASSASSGAYTAGVKGYSGAIKSAPLRLAPVKVARYVSVPTGGRTVVNFSQGGPVPYQYNYSFK